MPVTLENAYTPPLDTGLLNAPLDAPTFGQAFKATFAYQYSPLLDRIEEESVFGNRSFDPEFDPFAQAGGYEEYLGQIARAKDQEHLDYIKRNIDDRLFEKDKSAIMTCQYFLFFVWPFICHLLNLVW